MARNSGRPTEFPGWGLVFQYIGHKNRDFVSKRFGFCWGAPVLELAKLNGEGDYFPALNVVRVNKLFSKAGIGPDYEYVMNHPQWLMLYKDGSPVVAGLGEFAGPCLDLGNSEYVDYVIQWLKQKSSTGPVVNVGLDNGMFMYADRRWAKYDTHEAYRAAWEYFLHRISEALRPQHKVILNVGGCDLPTFARMIKWVDGALFEDLCEPLHNPKFEAQKARETIIDRWQKGQWCAEHGKVWAVRHNATVAALKLPPGPGTPPFFLSVSDREIIVSSLGQQVLGKIDLTRPNADTVGKVAKCLKDFNINVTVATPYPETPSPGAFQALTYTKVEGGLTMKLKQAPREAFLFGYAAVLMTAGPNSYFILGDERRQEYYYPEMDWELGAPKGEMREVTPQVFRRDFKNYAAFLNLSQAPFTLPDSRPLAPFRGGLVPIP